MQKTHYLLENYEVISSPWKDLEAGDVYQNSKIKTKFTESQYQSYLSFHNMLVGRYNKVAQKVGRNTIGLIMAGTYSEATGLLSESLKNVKADLVSYINNQIL